VKLRPVGVIEIWINKNTSNTQTAGTQ